MVSWLLALPVIGKVLGNVFGFVGSKGRLIIEYGLVAIVVTLLGGMAALWQGKLKTEVRLVNTEKNLGDVNNRLQTAETVNDIQNGTIDNLKDLRAKDARVLDKLITDYRTLARDDSSFRNRLTKLENSNADVKSYLNQPIPVELACVLNNTCTADKD